MKPVKIKERKLSKGELAEKQRQARKLQKDYRPRSYEAVRLAKVWVDYGRMG